MSYRISRHSLLRSPHYGFFDDWVLRKLIELNDRRALPVFLAGAKKLELKGGFLQEEISCYVLAIQGCALFRDTPPALTPRTGNDAAAWRCYSEILFWIYRNESTPADVRAKCAPLWQRLTGDLQLASPDPLYWLSHAAVLAAEGSKPHIKLKEEFPDEMRRILEQGLASSDRLTSFLPSHSIYQQVIGFMLSALGSIGDHASVQYLEPFVDHVEFGSTAVSAIRQLNKHAKP